MPSYIFTTSALCRDITVNILGSSERDIDAFRAQEDDRAREADNYVVTRDIFSSSSILHSNHPNSTTRDRSEGQWAEDNLLLLVRA